ncbi:MAG: hypothetical protein H6704_23775 [Myxococcales bacterium]|nr:hypothetical protein [Myxococcales bacterium]MCB9539245.1 hypothetical protein [Myxococcales bacterium]
MFGRRPDGTLVRDLAPVRRFLPFISPRRNDSLVYAAQTLPVEAALAHVAALNGARPDGPRVTLFHLVLRAIAVALHERPRMNRFVSGGRIYQRDGIWLSFSAKKAFAEDAPILTVKRRFDPAEPVEAMVDGVLAPLGAARGGALTQADREVSVLLRLPVPLLRVAVGFAGWADRLGLLPRSMIESDPLFASAFVANLGSVGLEAGYHHLWEWGTCSVFCVMGRIAGDEGARTVTLKWSFDERVADGFYAATALAVVARELERPPGRG